MRALFVGVDGGATKCIVRVEDADGHLLGQVSSGPANIRLSVEQAWQSINTALEKMPDIKNSTLHVGMGLAGCEIDDNYQRFLRTEHHFDTLLVTSDAHVACLGAHGGQDGAIIIAGTGTVGYQIYQGETKKVSGWGFPYDDKGSGAWIGLQAIQLALRCFDGRQPSSALSDAIFAYFNKTQANLIHWIHQATSTQFAELAPLVIQESQRGDAIASVILAQAAEAIDQIGDVLDAEPCALVGGVTPFLQPLLSTRLQSRLRPCLATPAEGAILLVREHLS